MEALLVKELGYSAAKAFGVRAGGSISQGQGFEVDGGRRIFVKQNGKSEAKGMFQGELEGLEALQRTGCVRVPKPLKVFELPDGGAAIAFDFVEMHPLKSASGSLGENLARLHLHNSSSRHSRGPLLEQQGSDDAGDSSPLVASFGFHAVTCCGYLPQDNTWTDDWPTFYTNRRLQTQIDRIVREQPDSEMGDHWLRLLPKMPHFFHGLDIFPSLLHGDLWSGNAAQTAGGDPVVFDPAAVYGHHEFDLAISTMFGSLGRPFYTAYHQLIPKADGFDTRQKLYQLYHYLNHYNHFGAGYRGSCLRLMAELCTVSLP
ncbi:Fructosamine-3-kinase [Hypsibius exemplaris]|uniref:protein-ribulosamine 3-kinase n=1 Tax=Hypsibius exemplaris TaxID=2072580 RepID=A0A1W0X3H9_HYPEX|nr:Fructosamine-3-kinase [Hypsibius exemplaris]